MKIKIIDMDHSGNGIGKIDNKICFIPKTITNDICEINIYKENRNYNIGRLNKIVEKSNDRTNSICPYYNNCGGCNISNLTYKKQLEFKLTKVKNIFKKYLNMDINPEIIASKKEYGYRNKITYHKDNELGLISLDNTVIDIDKCLLVSDKVNELYKIIKCEDLSKVKTITIKECDNGLILDVLGDINIDNLKDKCLSIYINDKCIYKKEDGYILINNIKYNVSNKSFFQINTSNISSLYDEIIRVGKFKKTDKVIDLYCGVGSISLYISKYVDSVLGIEIVMDAIKDAKENAKINNINNAKFICGDVTKLIDDNINCDVIIVDPPRIGLSKHVSSVINNSNIDKIIYVSCDPMTLVRDIKRLDNYIIKDISLVDMFPQTHHCESITVLERR